MAIHDAYARRTPYELFLPDDDFAEERFEAVRAEAAERGVTDLGEPEGFVLLMAVGETLRELKGPEDDPELIRQHGLLLFHGFHFRENGERLWLLPVPAARYLVEASAPPERSPAPPAPAGYLQLPQHLFWARVATTPESVDGLFWAAGPDRVSVLAVLGVREDRPGFSVVPLPPLPLEDAAVWSRTAMREGGAEDFRSDMPGSELEALYEVRTPGEILKLLARAWGLMDPERAERREPPAAAGPAGDDGAGGDAPQPEDGERGGPAPSRLPWYRISLDDAERD